MATFDVFLSWIEHRPEWDHLGPMLRTPNGRAAFDALASEPLAWVESGRLPEDYRVLLADLLEREQRFPAEVAVAATAPPAKFAVTALPFSKLWADLLRVYACPPHLSTAADLESCPDWDDRGPAHVLELKALLEKALRGVDRSDPASVVQAFLGSGDRVVLPPVMYTGNVWLDGRHRLLALKLLGGVQWVPVIDLQRIERPKRTGRPALWERTAPPEGYPAEWLAKWRGEPVPDYYTPSKVKDELSRAVNDSLAWHRAQTGGRVRTGEWQPLLVVMGDREQRMEIVLPEHGLPRLRRPGRYKYRTESRPAWLLWRQKKDGTWVSEPFIDRKPGALFWGKRVEDQTPEAPAEVPPQAQSLVRLPKNRAALREFLALSYAAEVTTDLWKRLGLPLEAFLKFAQLSEGAANANLVALQARLRDALAAEGQPKKPTERPDAGAVEELRQAGWHAEEDTPDSWVQSYFVPRGGTQRLTIQWDAGTGWSAHTDASSTLGSGTLAMTLRGVADHVRDHRWASSYAPVSAGLAIEHRGRMWFVHPTGAPWEGSCSIPKGLVEGDEPWIDRALTETIEEVGLKHADVALMLNDVDDARPTGLIECRNENGMLLKTIAYWHVKAEGELLDLEQMPQARLQMSEVDWAGWLTPAELKRVAPAQRDLLGLVAPTEVTVRAPADRFTADLRALLADYKARGMDARAAYNALIRDRQLRPDVGMSDLNKLYEEISPKALTGAVQTVSFTPTHRYLLTGELVQATQLPAGNWRIIFERGNTGGEPIGDLPATYASLSAPQAVETDTPPKVRLAGIGDGWDYVDVTLNGVLWRWMRRAGGTIGTRGWELLEPPKNIATGREIDSVPADRAKSLRIAKKAADDADEAVITEAQAKRAAKAAPPTHPELEAALRGPLAVELPGFTWGEMGLPRGPTVSDTKGSTRKLLEDRYGAAALAPYVAEYTQAMISNPKWLAQQREATEAANHRTLTDAEWAEKVAIYRTDLESIAYLFIAAMIRKDPPSILAAFDKLNPNWGRVARKWFGSHAEAIVAAAQRADQEHAQAAKQQRAERDRAAKASAIDRYRFIVEGKEISGSAFVEFLRRNPITLVKHNAPKIDYFLVVGSAMWELDKTFGAALRAAAPELTDRAAKTTTGSRWVERPTGLGTTLGIHSWPTRYQWFDGPKFEPHWETAGTGRVLLQGVMGSADRKRLDRTMQMGLSGDAIRIVEIEMPADAPVARKASTKPAVESPPKPDFGFDLFPTEEVDEEREAEARGDDMLTEKLVRSFDYGDKRKFGSREYKFLLRTTVTRLPHPDGTRLVWARPAGFEPKVRHGGEMRSLATVLFLSPDEVEVWLAAADGHPDSQANMRLWAGRVNTRGEVTRTREEVAPEPDPVSEPDDEAQRLDAALGATRALPYDDKARGDALQAATEYIQQRLEALVEEHPDGATQEDTVAWILADELEALGMKNLRNRLLDGTWARERFLQQAYKRLAARQKRGNDKVLRERFGAEYETLRAELVAARAARAEAVKREVDYQQNDPSFRMIGGIGKLQFGRRTAEDRIAKAQAGIEALRKRLASGKAARPERIGRLPQQESDPRAEVGPFEFSPFGMVSASVRVNQGRRYIPEAERRSTTVRWTSEDGQERASTWDAGHGGGWTSHGGWHPPALVRWALIRLGVPLPPLRDAEQIDLDTPAESVPYSYRGRGALDVGLVAYLSGRA